MSDLIVETRYGKVQGSQQGPISVWKGIPFALPPTGERRFRAPQPPQPWTGVREATTFSPMAPQVPQMGASMVGALGAERAVEPRPMSEDCLYVLFTLFVPLSHLIVPSKTSFLCKISNYHFHDKISF
jgi:para-nitrobenzyl esterase